MKKYTALVETFFIAKNPSYHYGKLEQNQSVSTGQSELLTYESFDEWRNQLLTDTIITENHEYVDGFWQIIEEAPGNDIPY
jgi:hypothetical protein